MTILNATASPATVALAIVTTLCMLAVRALRSPGSPGASTPGSGDRVCTA